MPGTQFGAVAVEQPEKEVRLHYYQEDLFWEAMVRHRSLVINTGIDTFVLDDGWFGKRIKLH
ncbi:MAG: alpha-galactosidase [Lachnospiraceae bacterium]|nr:alpha-galactosidase [Lachnospiraceae bacterium]